jgi:hypothetical protein
MKKSKLFGLGLFMIMSLLTFSTTLEASSQFKDVPNTHWAKYDIDFLVSKGIIKGYADGTFKPEKPVSKRQVAIMLIRGLGLNTNNRPSLNIRDLNSNAEGYKEIITAIDEGFFITNDYFEPNKPITRIQMARALAIAYKISGEYQGSINDVKSEEDIKYVSALAFNGITNIYPDGTYKPFNQVTRAQFSAFMARSIKLNETFANAEQLQKYLNSNYSELNTKLANINFDITVHKYDNINVPYDYKINLGMDSYKFENVLNARLRSVEHARTAKEDVELARKQLNIFLENMAKDAIKRMPGKRIFAQNTQVTYTYPALKMGKLTVTKYSWTNYEPLSMKHEWPGEQPEDYYNVIYDFRNEDSEKVKKYKDDEWKRIQFKIEYSLLKYHDFKISEFRWTSFLDETTSSDR